jgi:SAM-dependent methyltransferase
MTTDKNDPFARWNLRYSSDDYLFGTEPAQFVRRHAGLIPPQASVLAVADGEGRNGVWLAAQGHRVDAVEGSPVAIAKARRLAAGLEAGYRIDQVDLLGWSWPTAAYDAVLAVFVQFVPAPDMPSFFAGLKQAVRPGGLLMLHGYTPKQLEYGTGGPGVLEQLYDDALLDTHFGDWPALVRESYEAELTEGAGHAGQSALVDLILRRP